MSAAAACNIDLDAFLTTLGRGDDTLATAGAVLRRIASDAIEVARIISLGQLWGGGNAAVGTENPDGDAQKKIEVLANEMFIDSLRRSPVAAILSEELSCPLVLDPAAPLVVAIDPLDGCSNIDTAVSGGTIFSILPAAIKATRPEEHFLRPGREQIAAGFFIYGPQTSLALTFGDGVHIFTLDRDTRVFRLAIPKVSIPQDSTDHWPKTTTCAGSPPSSQKHSAFLRAAAFFFTLPMNGAATSPVDISSFTKRIRFRS